MPKSKISKFVSIVLKLMLVLGVVSLFFLPTLYDMFADTEVIDFAKHSIYYKGAFYLCFITSLGILYKLIRIFDNVYKESPFKKSIEIDLKVIAVLFMILSVIVAIKIIFIPTLLSIAVSLITFIVSLSFYVLSQIFKVAIEYKDEIDHTV